MSMYYVDPAGSDTSPYDTWAKAATSLQTVIDVISAGDTIYARGTQNLALNTQITIPDSTDGDTTHGFISIIGCNSGGTEDGTRFVINANSSSTSNKNCLEIANSNYWNIRNVEFKNAASDGMYFSTGSSLQVTLQNCSAHNNGNHGFNGSQAYYCSFIQCTSYLNGGTGIYSGLYNFYLACSSHDNSAYGLYYPYGIYQGCLIYNNSNQGVRYTSGQCWFSSCIIHGNTNDGVMLNGNTDKFIGCRFTAAPSGKYAIDVNSRMAVIGWCYFDQAGGSNLSSETSILKLKDSSGSDTNTWNGSDTDYGYNDLSNDDYSLASGATLNGDEYLEIPIT